MRWMRTAALATAVALPAASLSVAQEAEPPATLRNHHADPDASLTAAGLENMRLLWSIETEHPVSHTPLVADGRVFFADWGGSVYAVDAATGKPVWRRKVEEPKLDWPWHGFAGTGTLGGGLLYLASTEGNAFALDPATGEVLWKTRIAEDEQAGSISRLTYHDGRLFIGLSSVEEPMTKMRQGFTPDFQGKVLALNARTGETVWQTRLVEPPHNGVGVWSGFALDPEEGTLYFTTGNNYTGEASPLSDAIVAVDAATGDIKWARQVTMHDVWTPVSPEGPDYDFSGAPQLFEAEVEGQPRKLVGAGQKSGIFHVWDRVTGDPVWATSIGYGGVDGGMHGEASIAPERIIAWSNNGYHHTKDPSRHPVSIKALDPATGRQLWVRDQTQPALLFAAGFLANDVYFLPALDGRLRAYSANDGKLLWTSEPGPGPMTSSVWVDGGMAFVGAGAPKIFGEWAKGPSGVFAFGTGETVAEER